MKKWRSGAAKRSELLFSVREQESCVAKNEDSASTMDVRPSMAVSCPNRRNEPVPSGFSFGTTGRFSTGRGVYGWIRLAVALPGRQSKRR